MGDDMRIEQPKRKRHSYKQTINALPERVFPLLCPVREGDWVEGWDPRLVLSESGVAEQDGIFITASDGHETVWVISRHEPACYEVEMIMVTPGRTVGKLEISLTPFGEEQTHAAISYSHTSLGPDGDDFLKTFTPEHYQQFMRRWEAEMNHYLATGEKLDAD